MPRLNEYIKGKCLEMCPESEIQMREKQKLLHILEMVPGTEKMATPKADRSRMVKCFQRSAAGKSFDKEEELRPPEVLLSTISYLIIDVADVDYLPWYKVYDFITDRLMSVRQDMVVQNISMAETLCLLQPIIKFHAFAAYKLCCEKISNFDPVLNKNHLQECLKKLLYVFDSINCNYILGDDATTCKLTTIRKEFEALYVILNLGDKEALTRHIKIPVSCRNKEVLSLSLNHQAGNFIRTCRMIKNLPPLAAALASIHLPEIRRRALEKMCIAYNSKHSNFPLKDLSKLLLYDSTSDLSNDCKYYGMCVRDESVIFMKNVFKKNEKPVPPRKEKFVEEKLKGNNIQHLIMY